MIYLDYSATTPVNKEVLDAFYNINLEFIGNANSAHELGIKCNSLISASTKQIKDILNINNKDIIFTSGSSEANNLAIIGTALKFQNRGKHIITTRFEHSSVYGPLDYLKKLGFEVTILKHNKDGIIDINDLKNVIRDDTILVIVNAVNSEIGLREPIEEIGLFLKKYPKCIYHVDLTQAIGKVRINMDNIDLASFTAHKIYGLKGIGCLVKNKSIEIKPIIYGGKSTSIYRSGTPAHPLIASFAKSLRIANSNIDANYLKVKSLNELLKNELGKYPNVYINSNDYCIPHILNISVKGIKSEVLMNALSKSDIYVSTKSACSDESSLSESVLSLTSDVEKAKSSIRISLSHLTTEEEIKTFLKEFKRIYNEFESLK